MNEEIIFPLGTVVTSSFRGFPRDYVLDEDATNEKKTVWAISADGESYELPIEGMTKVNR